MAWLGTGLFSLMICVQPAGVRKVCGAVWPEPAMATRRSPATGVAVNDPVMLSVPPPATQLDWTIGGAVVGVAVAVAVGVLVFVGVLVNVGVGVGVAGTALNAAITMLHAADALAVAEAV